MDSKELRNLHEAYMDVYAPQEIDEGLRSAVKRLLGGKKEAEAPKPESRGAQLRTKYNVGPEKSDTSAKRQILDRSRATAEKDKTKFGGSKYSKSVATKSKEAHDRYLKAGYSKYGADDARGSGNKARKRAAALNKEEFEFVVNALIEEGYDLSSYTWDEMYDICLDEAVKGESGERRKDLAAERRSGIKPLSAKEGEGYASHKLSQMSYVKRKRMGEEVEGLEEISKELSGRVVNARIAKTGRAFDKEMKDRTPENMRDTVDAVDKETRAKRLAAGVRKRRNATNEEVEIFDVVLEYLVVEGYADTNESALVIMANMSEEWRQSIVEVKMDPRGRPASGSMNVYKQSKPNNDPAFQAALKSVRDADTKKTPEQRKAELDAYKERQMNNK
jgi:hypothetical protein